MTIETTEIRAGLIQAMLRRRSAYLMMSVAFVAASAACVYAPAFAQEAAPSTGGAPAVDLPPVRVNPAAQPKAPRAAKKAQPKRMAAPAAPTPPVTQAPVPPATSTMRPMPAYAGGQVATGGQLGMLGNRSVMDTPFSQVSYTNKFIQDQQARTVQDVLNNDPSVLTTTSSGTPHDFQVIRGIGGFGTDGTRSLNGVAGMAPMFFPSADYIERVEILKGASGLLNGMGLSSAATSGALGGGTVNLVTKQATNDPIAQLTTRYVSNSQFGTHLDVGRRFGDSKEFGVRFNGSIDGGHTPIDTQRSNLSNAALNLDYAGERVRLSADFAHQAQKLDPTNPYIFARFTTLTAFPAAPNSTTSLAPRGSEQNTRSTVGLLRGEVDLLPNVTAYGAIGKQRAEYHLNGFEYAWLDNQAGDYGLSPAIQRYQRDILSTQGGIRALANTGPVNHALNLSFARSDLTYRQAESEGNFYMTGTIYNPVFPNMAPAPDPGDPRKLYDVKVSSVGVADTLSILDERIQFTAGVRYQQVGIDQFSQVTGLQISEYSPSAWTPAFAAVVKPWQNVSVYANYIEDLRPGQIVSSAFQNSGEILPPYVSKQQEAGVKVDWGRVTTTLAFFQITRAAALAIPDPNGGLPTLSQNGEERYRGIELMAYGELTPGVRLMSGITLIDARLLKTDDGLLDGKRADTAPNIRTVVGAEWDAPFASGLTLIGRVTHTGDAVVQAETGVAIPSWTTLDLGARYTFASPWNQKPVVVRFNVDNVFDADYWAGTYAGGLVYRGPARTFRLSSSFNF